MENKRLIVVLGMHRSGSSAITKGLEVMGVNLGSRLMSADASNEKGYFEDLEINQLNTEVLRASGHDWNSLSLIEDEDILGDKLADLKNRAIDTLRGKLADSERLGIKDPRFCRILPFWMDVFAHLQLDVSYVIILRNPESIAASLFARDAFPRVKSLYLWLEHMIPVFRETSGFKRSVVDFDQLVAHPKMVIESLAKDLDLDEQLDHDALVLFENEFIDSSLKHHQWEQGSETGFTPRLITELDGLLQDVSEQKVSIDSSEFMDEINKIENEYRDRSDILAYIDLLDSIIFRDHFSLKNANTQLDTLSADYDQTKEMLKSKKKIISRRNLQIKRFKTKIAERDELLASLQLSLSDRDAKIKALKLSISDRDSEIGKLETSLKNQEELVSKSINQIDNLQRQIESNVSDTEALAAKLDEIQTSLFWRVSLISRKFWQFFEVVFCSAKEKFHLIPMNDLKRARVIDNSWMSTGVDPHFRLVPLSGKMPGGWTRIKTCIQSNPGGVEFNLYLDCGEGFIEKNVVTIPISSQGDVDEIMYLPGNLKAIRWDPTQQKGEFKQMPIVFSRASFIRRKLHMINRVRKVLWNAPSEIKKENGLAWKTIVSDLNHAYEATRPVIISKNLQQQEQANSD